MAKLTFIDYVNSKDQLRSAISNIPQHTTEYEVRRYCKIPIGETKQDKQHIMLRPKHKIIIEWLYEDVKNPTPLNVRFEGPVEINQDDQQPVLWTGERLLKWLMRNTHKK